MGCEYLVTQLTTKQPLYSCAVKYLFLSVRQLIRLVTLWLKSKSASGTVCFQRNRHQHAPEFSGTFRSTPEPPGTFRDLPEPTPAHPRTLRNLPELSGIPEVSGTFRNPPPEPTPAHTGTLRTFRNSPPQIHQHTRNSPEPSGTFLRNLLLRPAPAHTAAYLAWRPHKLTLLEKKHRPLFGAFGSILSCVQRMLWFDISRKMILYFARYMVQHSPT